jgi:dienelactone hydrolase
MKVKGPTGAKFLTAVLRPRGTGPFPVVVVLHGANGLTQAYLSVAEDVARAGFLVVLGCWQAGEAGTAGTRICSEATPQARWVADPAANSGKELIALARTLKGGRADRIGLLGMSRGGHAALWAASTGADVQAVVVDAPAHASNVDPAPAKPLDVLAGLAAPVLILHGTADPVIPVGQSQEYERAARAAGKDVTGVYFGGVGHLTLVAPESQVDARKRAISFLKEHLLN